jgi:hypothetical protein
MRLKFLQPYAYISLAVLLLTSACTEEIDIELDSTYSRLVVEGTVTTDFIKHHVKLSVTSDYFSNKPSPPVQDALVKLTFGDETMQMIESDTTPGLYETPYAFKGIIGTTYELDISQVDVNDDGEEEQYHAKSTMPGGSELEKIDLKYYPTSVATGYAVFMYLYHPVETRDWFGFKLIKNSDLLTDSLFKYSVLSDELFDTGYLPGLPVGFLSDDEQREALNPGDTLTFELNCIDESYFTFVSEAQLEIAGNFPLFSGPPSNIASNIDRGAMGIFTAYSIQRISVVLE